MSDDHEHDHNPGANSGGDETKDWIYRDSTKRLLWWALGAVCLLSVLAEFFLHRHSYFGIDKSFAFYAILGFGMCALMILAAKGLGIFLKKEPDFYDEPGDPDAVEDAGIEAGQTDHADGKEARP